MEQRRIELIQELTKLKGKVCDKAKRKNISKKLEIINRMLGIKKKRFVYKTHEERLKQRIAYEQEIQQIYEYFKDTPMLALVL